MIPAVLAVLSQAEGPLSLPEITRRVMADQGLDPADTRKMLAKSNKVASALRNLRHRGTVRSEMGPNDRLVWLIVES